MSQSSDEVVGGPTIPYPFQSAAELLDIAAEKKFAISRIVWENEKALRDENDIRSGILKLWKVMKECVERGCRMTGILPGGLKVERRAAALFQKLSCHVY